MKNCNKYLFSSFIILALAIAAFAQHGNDGIPAQTELAGPVTVPMTLYGNKPVVEAKINGKGPFKFFLDTGAGITVLDQAFADEIKLTTDGRMKVGDPADPQGIDAARNVIDTLEIGGLVLKKATALSFSRASLYPPGAPRGVLGMPLFRKLLLTIDYPQSRIIIEKGNLPAADEKKIISFKFTEGGIFGLQLKVGGVDMVAHIDSGSGSSISFPDSMKEKLSLASPVVEVGRGRTVAGEAIVYGAKFAGEISLGEHTVKDPDIRFFGRLRTVNLGYAFLRPFAITIDQQNLRMRFEKGVEPIASDTKPDVKPGGQFAEFAGTYGERRITAESDGLYLQRLVGPQGAGPKLKLTQIRSGEFALEGETVVRFRFARDASGKVASLNILNREGAWETATRTN